MSRFSRSFHALAGLLLAGTFGVFLILVAVASSAETPSSAEKGPAAAGPAEPQEISFQRDVQPIFARRCLSCHGPKKQESAFRLDVRAVLLRGGDFGEPAVLPGNGAASFLIDVVSGRNEDLVMPPEGPRLSADEIAKIRAWIDAGAKMPEGVDAPQEETHWSFRPLASVMPPLQGDPWVATPVDGFILARLREHGLEPSPPADRVMLIRRLFLVMLGLLPTPTEVARFQQDPDPLAYQRLVDRVLASPRYGERWARHWLDVVRFGETHGFETNRERPHAWPYRDYVIDAWNADLPYGQFVQDQLAGDRRGADVATGFLVAGPYDLVKSRDINLTLMQRQDELADMINATGTTFLGLTLGCARCHNHKFDPVTQRDYYAMQAVFAGVRHGDRSLTPSGSRQAELAALKAKIASLRKRLAPFVPLARVGDAPADAQTRRPPVQATHNVERIRPVRARWIRFTIHKTSGAEPCLDELEAWSGERNVAAASNGGTPTCSSTLPGYPIHKLKHINDQQYGNAHSWISNEPGQGWVQIEFAETSTIDRIEWGRDREGTYRDRLPLEYTIEVAADPGEWVRVASSADRLPPRAASGEKVRYRFEGLEPQRAAQGRAWLRELNNAEQRREALAVVPTVYAGKFQQPGPTFRLYRGDPTARREQVVADAPAHFARLGLEREAPEHERRLRLAAWIAAPENPLTARTLVNRLWQYHFGSGIVATPNDLGVNGTPPTHPRLLDWLAGEAIRRGWSIKQVQRQILLSNTFQQSSLPRGECLAVDGDSRLLWRFPPRRLAAEAIRDNLLAVSGVLDLRMGGPGFSAFEVQMENVRHYFPKTSFGPEDWRRMIYMTKVRQEQDAVFGVFDCPDASQAVPKRSRSTTPLQALNLFNSTFSLDQSTRLASRLRAEAPQGSTEQVDRAFQLVFSRSPGESEMTSCLAFVQQHGLVAFCRALLNANEFLLIP